MLLCWTLQSIFGLLQVNTPNYTRDASAYGIDGWWAPGFLADPAHAKGWASWVNSHWSSVLGGNLGGFVWGDSGFVISGNARSGQRSFTASELPKVFSDSLTAQGELWRVMSGWYTSWEQAAASWAGSEVCGEAPPTPTPGPTPGPAPTPTPGPTPGPTPTPTPAPGSMTLTLRDISLDQLQGAADGSYVQLSFSLASSRRADNAAASLVITIKDSGAFLTGNNLRFKLGQPSTDGIGCDMYVNGNKKAAFVAGLGYFPEFDEEIAIEDIALGAQHGDVTVSVTPKSNDRRTFLDWAQDITTETTGFVCVRDGALVDKSGDTKCPEGAARYDYKKSQGSIYAIDLDQEGSVAEIPFTSYIRPYTNDKDTDAYSWGNDQSKESTTDPYDSFINGLTNTGTNQWLVSSMNTAAFTADGPTPSFPMQCNTTLSGYTNTLGKSTTGFIGTVSDGKVTMFQGIWGSCTPGENQRQHHKAGDYVEYTAEEPRETELVVRYSFNSYDSKGEKTVHAAGILDAPYDTTTGRYRYYLPCVVVGEYHALEYFYEVNKEETATLLIDIESVFSSDFGYVGHTYPLGVVKTADGKELQTVELDKNGGEIDITGIDWAEQEIAYLAYPKDRDDATKLVTAGIYVNATFSETAFVDAVVGPDAFYDSQNRVKTSTETSYTTKGYAAKPAKATGRHNTWLTDEWTPVGSTSKLKLRTMTYQEYDPRHPAVLINPDVVFVEELKELAMDDPFAYDNFLIVVTKKGTDTAGAEQRQDAAHSAEVEAIDDYTISEDTRTGEVYSRSEQATLGSVEMNMQRIKQVDSPTQEAEGDWFYGSGGGVLIGESTPDSLASLWRSWEPLGCSYSTWASNTWVNYPAFIMRAKMSYGYVGCFVVLMSRCDKQLGCTPFRPVEFNIADTTDGQHEYTAWPKVAFTQSYAVAGGSGVVYNLLTNGDKTGQPAGQLADVLFYNQTQDAVFATVVKHGDPDTQYAYLRLDKDELPWTRQQLSKGELIGTSQMATQTEAGRQFYGTINGLAPEGRRLLNKLFRRC